MPEFVVADVGPGGKVEVDGGDDEGGGRVAGGALQQPIRGCDCGHVTSSPPIPADLAQLLPGGGVVVSQDHHHRHRHAHQHQQQPVRVPTTTSYSVVQHKSAKLLSQRSLPKRRFIALP